MRQTAALLAFVDLRLRSLTWVVFAQRCWCSLSFIASLQLDRFSQRTRFEINAVKVRAGAVQITVIMCFDLNAPIVQDVKPDFCRRLVLRGIRISIDANPIFQKNAATHISGMQGWTTNHA